MRLIDVLGVLVDIGSSSSIVTKAQKQLTKRDLVLLDESGALADRVDVAHVDQLAHRIFREAHGAPALLDDARERELWATIAHNLDVPFTPALVAPQLETVSDWAGHCSSSMKRRKG